MTNQFSSRLALCGVAFAALFSTLAGYGIADATEKPAPPFVIIKRGAAGSYGWLLLTRREASPLATKYRPCLGVGFSARGVPNSSVKVFYTCGVVNPAPNVVVDSVGSGRNRRTVIGMAYDRQVREVLIDLGSRGVRHLRLTLLAKKLARKAHLAQYRYSALELAGRFCIRKMIGLDGMGNAVVDDKPSICA